MLYFRTLQYKKVNLAFIKAQKSRQRLQGPALLGLFLHSNRGYARQSWKIGHDGIVLENSFISESEELIKILPHIKCFNVEIVGMAKGEKRAF